MIYKVSRHKNKLELLLEYACLKAVISAFDRMSLEKALGMAENWADFWYFMHRSRRNIACENIRLGGIASDEQEISRIARSSFRHFATLLIEGMKFDPLAPEGAANVHVETVIAPRANDILSDAGKGMIAVSGHIGNWELGVQLLSRFKPVAAIARKMNNPYVDRLVNERRKRANLLLISKYDNPIRKARAALKNAGALAMLTDLNARKRGIIVDFLGRPASTYPTAALLHLATGAPICFGSCIRLGPASYRFSVHDPIIHERTGDNKRDIREITEAINRELEAVVRKYPEQYLWGHRRWRIPS